VLSGWSSSPCSGAGGGAAPRSTSSIPLPVASSIGLAPTTATPPSPTGAGVEPLGEGCRVSVGWDLHPQTFWRRVLFGRVRARQLARTELPASLAALARAAEERSN